MRRSARCISPWRGRTIARETMPGTLRSFAPYLVHGHYAIRVDIQVMPGKLRLSPRHLQGSMGPARQPLSYVVSAKDGLPLSIPAYELDRGLVDRPGLLHHLPLEPKTPGR
jgi:hypothetical protein